MRLQVDAAKVDGQKKDIMDRHIKEVQGVEAQVRIHDPVLELDLGAFWPFRCIPTQNVPARVCCVWDHRLGRSGSGRRRQ
eukprot:SAG22_NODE_4151_length_1367_cov_1.256309_1_plen_80_part_00